MRSYVVSTPADRDTISLFRRYDGVPVEVQLSDGRMTRVLNIAWGYDLGDAYAHVTTNISPEIEGEPIDFFSTSEIESVSLPDSEVDFVPGQ